MATKKIAIAGAGITGLTAAWYLQKKGHDVDVFEQHGYAGGSIRSIKQDQWLLEFGPNTILVREKKVADFLKNTGAWEKRIQANPQSSKRYIVKNGQLVQLPLSLLGGITTPLFSPSAKLRVLGEPFISKVDDDSETIASFAKRRLGQEIFDYALNPFIAGIYANQPEKLSLRHTFPVMHDMEQKYGSLIFGMFAGGLKKKDERVPRELISFNEGLHQLVDTITEQINPIFFDHKIKKLYRKEKQWYLKSTNGDKGPYDEVILNIPLYKWDDELIPVEVNELEEIRKVEYPPLSVFHLGFKKKDVKHPLDGFGFLVPEKENRNVLGALFSSTLFPGRAPADCHLLTVFIGGGRQPELAQKNSDSLLKIVLHELCQLLGVEGEPVLKEHVFWPKSIPAYHVGYDRILQIFESIEKQNPGIHLAGNFREGVSVPDCIKNGIKLADKISG